jgi:hypothetical protein
MMQSISDAKTKALKTDSVESLFRCKECGRTYLWGMSRSATPFRIFIPEEEAVARVLRGEAHFSGTCIDCRLSAPRLPCSPV